MVVTGHVPDNRIQLRVRAQQLIAERRVLLHDRIFSRAQSARFIKNFVRNLKLAQVVKQSAHTGNFQVLVGQAQKACEGNGKDGHPQTVFRGIGVAGLDAAHPEHCTGVGFDTFHAFPDNRAGVLQVQIIAPFNGKGDLFHECLGLAPYLVGAGDLFREGAGFRKWGSRALFVTGDPCQGLSQHLLVAFNQRPFAVLTEYASLVVVLKSKTLEQYGHFDPGSVQLDDAHAVSQQIDGQTDALNSGLGVRVKQTCLRTGNRFS